MATYRILKIFGSKKGGYSKTWVLKFRWVLKNSRNQTVWALKICKYSNLWELKICGYSKKLWNSKIVANKNVWELKNMESNVVDTHNVWVFKFVCSQKCEFSNNMWVFKNVYIRKLCGYSILVGIQ